jgi:hypothetical protein
MNFAKLERILDKRMAKFIRKQVNEREQVRLKEIRDFCFRYGRGFHTDGLPGYYEGKCYDQLQDLTKLSKKHDAIKSSFLLSERKPAAYIQTRMAYSSLDRMLNRKLRILVMQQVRERDKADEIISQTRETGTRFYINRLYSSREELELEHAHQIDTLHEKQQRIKDKFFQLQKQREQNCKDRER